MISEEIKFWCLAIIAIASFALLLIFEGTDSNRYKTSARNLMVLIISAAAVLVINSRLKS